MLWHIEKSKHIRAFEGKSFVTELFFFLFYISIHFEVEIQISWCFFRWFLSILAHHTDCTSAKRWKNALEPCRVSCCIIWFQVCMNVLGQLFMLTLQEQSFDQKEVEVREIICASTAKKHWTEVNL